MYWIHPDYPDAASIFHSHLNRLIQMTNKKKRDSGIYLYRYPGDHRRLSRPGHRNDPVRIPSGAGLRNTGRPDSRAEF